MFPKKTNPYGQQPPYGQIPGSGGGYTASAAPARGADGARFGGNTAHGAAGQYGGAYASVYGAQQVSGFAGKVPGSFVLPSLQTNATTLSESSKLSSGATGSSLGRLNDDYLATREYGHKLDRYGADYALERRLYGERPANLGRRDGLTDLDRRYLDHIPGSHQASSVGHQQPLKAQLQPGSSIRQADYFAGRIASNHQGSQEISAYGRIEADHRNLSVLGSASYGGQQPTLFGGAPRTNIGSFDYGQGPSNSGYGDYGSVKGLHHPSLETDYRDGVLSHVHPGISMVDERAGDRVGYRRELDLRDEERRRDLLWERERVRERELQELELRARERDTEHERQRERDRERERERGRERERAREKERSRDRRHRADQRRERTPPRALVDRRRSSSIRSEKPLRRLAPRRDPVHRHHSPVKQIKREYICKILPFRLVDSERDYLSLTKRYPRLAIAQDFSKVVLNWPEENLNLSLHTPVSLEHDIHEVDEGAVSSSETSYTGSTPKTIFHAKVLLMSGMSKGTFAVICSIRSAEERIVHLNNILKFAVFKKDYALSVIGGPWDAAIDGGNPLVDSACLIQTAIRYVKEQVQVDLSKCTHWNHFLEVHYNRVGKDGLFSYKEVTVLFVPNLSESLPSMDLWKNNWIAHRKSKAERKQVATKREKNSGDAKKQMQVSGEPSEGKIDDGNLREGNIGHDAIKIEKSDTIMDQHSKDGVQNSSVKDEKELEKVEERVGQDGDVQGFTSGNTSVDHTVEDKKPIKRKIIKKVVKKVVRQRPTTETSGVKLSKEDDKAVVSGSASKVVEEQVQVMTEDDGKQQVAGIINEQPQTKKPGKKKIIRRVVKRKLSTSGCKLDDPAMPAETSKPVVDVESVKNDEGLTEAGKLQTKPAEVLNTPAEEISNQRNEEKIDKEGHTSIKVEKSHGDKLSEQEAVKRKDAKKEKKNVNKNKDDKEKKNGDSKRDPKQKSVSESKEKKRLDEPPRLPGFILKAKRSKGSKLRSASLSLDGLLNYTTNDIEESVFELSLFAESFSEMLQYRMGCIILSFLEKLYMRYVIKKNQRKRPREEDSVINEDKKLSDKRPKIPDDILNNDNPLTNDAMTKVGEEKMILDSSASAHVEPEAEERMGDEDPEYEEDPEEVEMYASDEDMDNTTAEEQTEANAELLNNTEAKPEVKAEDNINKETGKELILENIASFDAKPATGVDKQSITENGVVQIGTIAVSKEEKIALTQKEDEVVDKDLLQAFRYFDQNNVGYIKVEDLGCIVHNLGKCLSNKDVKDLAETAHAESNSARDGRVIYAKLVKIVDL